MGPLTYVEFYRKVYGKARFPIEDRVIVTKPAIGLCFCQVCCVKDALRDEILEAVNRLNPSGTTNGWTTVVMDDEDSPEYFETAPPVQCEDHPDRIHYLVIC